MNWRRHFLEAATLIVAATVCALVANAFASRERKLAVPGSYATPAPTSSRTSTPLAGEIARATQSTASAPAAPKSPQSTPTTTQQPSRPAADNRQPMDRFPPHPDKAYVEIHGNDVAWLHSKGVLTLDARRTSVYEQGHIAGARPFSVWEADIDDKVNKLFAERSDPREQALPIVIYCSGGDCEDSHMLAQKLWGIQFNNVYVYKDGFPDWQKRGGAIRTGANP